MHPEACRFSITVSDWRWFRLSMIRLVMAVTCMLGLVTLASADDPVVPAIGDLTVIRGGGFTYPASMCGSAVRSAHHASSRINFTGDLGFRVALCRVEKR